MGAGTDGPQFCRPPSAPFRRGVDDAPKDRFFAKAIRKVHAQISPEQTANRVEPIYVESLRLKDFRCFEELELHFNRPSSLEGRWTCIAGINGSGKSTILQALGVALLGNPLALELGGERLNRMRRLADLFNRKRGEVQIELRETESNQLHGLDLAIDEGRIVSKGSTSVRPSTCHPTGTKSDNS